MNVARKYSDFLFNKTMWYSIIFIGILAKLLIFPVATGDYVVFLEPWMEFIKSNGYFSALRHNFYNYTPTYIYILIAITKTSIYPLYAIKAVSVIFEFVAAFFLGKIAETYDKKYPYVLISLAIVPIIPSIMLNSSYLSQCDSIYAAFVIGSLYFFVKNQKLASILFLAIAFAFKMQTAFILPFYFVMLLRGNIRWQYFLIIPFVFILAILPTLFYGRDILDLLGIYLSQSERYPYLTMNFPNLYIWINNDYFSTAKSIGIIFTVILTLVTGFWLSNKKYIFTTELCIKLMFLSSIVIPFVLPGMHERYLYLGDILGILYFLVIRKNIYLPLGIIVVSFYSYLRISRYNEILPMEPAFFVYLSVIIFTITDFIKSLKNESKPVEF